MVVVMVRGCTSDGNLGNYDYPTYSISQLDTCTQYLMCFHQKPG